jgi:undecaprenyl-diphosphatase
MDASLVIALNRFAESSAFTRVVSIFFASWLLWVGVALVAIFWFVERRVRFVSAVVAAVSAVLAWVVNQWIGELYFRPRPFVDLAAVHKLISKSVDEKSFPSDHTAIAFALALAVFMVNRKWGIALLILAVLTALGRVLVGVHYPTDVLGGAVVGIIAALAVHSVTHALLRTHHKKSQSV